jgi:hypothetical protein
VLLGEYEFTTTAGYIEVSSENGQASADAVRLIKSGGGANIPPVAGLSVLMHTVTASAGESRRTETERIFLK